MRILSLLLLTMPCLALADQITLTCEPPTQNADGTELTDLAGIRFYESQVSGGPYTLIGDEQVCSLVVERGEGTYYYVATAYNTAGTESVFSNEVSKVVDPVAPNPPVLSVQADAVAYAIQQVSEPCCDLIIYPVALVDDLTQCDPWVKVSNAAHPDGLSLIPRDAVTFAPDAFAATVYAECTGG